MVLWKKYLPPSWALIFALLSRFRPKRTHICQKTNKKTEHDCQIFWGNISWTDETKVELLHLVASKMLCKTNKAFHNNNIKSTVNHSGGSILVWGCFVASRPGRFAIIDLTMHSALYLHVWKSWRRISSHEFVTWNSSTLIQNTPANLCLNAWMNIFL